MPITELALCRLKTPSSLSSPTLRSHLLTAKTAMETYTNLPFAYYQQIEDPSLIYILGAWSSLDQHLNHWIPSPENQQLLELLKDDITVEWLLHVDVDKATLPLGAKVLAIGRWFVARENREALAGTFGRVRGVLEGFKGEGRVGAGWRIDGDGEERNKEEFVVFTGWESVEQHAEFGRSEGFQEFKVVTEYIEGHEVRHARPVDLS